MPRAPPEDNARQVGPGPQRHADDRQVPPNPQVRPATRRLSKGINMRNHVL